MRTTDALFYPLRGANNESALVVGLILGFLIAAVLRLGVLGVVLALVPAILFLGFVGRILERSLEGDRSIPGYRPVPALLRQGARLAVVLVVYAVPPLLVLAGASRALSTMAADGLGSTGGYAFLAISTGLLVVWGVFGYVVPAVMIAVVQSGSLRSIVAIGTITDIVGRLSYLVTWIEAALLSGFTLSLAAILITSNRVAGLVAIPLVVYVLYVSGHMVASACIGDDTLWS